MGKIIIVEEKAEMMVNKLEKIKTCLNELIECISEHMEEGDSEGYGYEENPWDEEYEVKRRKGIKSGITNMRRPMGYSPRSMSRY